MAAAPPNLKPINSFLKLAKEHDKRDPTVAYYCRMYAVQRGIKLDSKSPDCKQFLLALMDQIEENKKVLIATGNEAVGNDIVAQAHVESICIKLFTWADSEDRNGVFNKNITKAFYSASLLYDVLSQFGELTDECAVQQKYAKWKATYLHKCMQTGETPISGPEGSGFEDDLSSLGNLPAGPVYNHPGYPTDNSTNLPYPPGPSQPQQPYSYTQQPTQPTQPDRPTPKPRQSATPSQPSSSYTEPSTTNASSSDIDFIQASKFCKFAMSALQYEDVDTAVENLTKALNMLGTAKK